MSNKCYNPDCNLDVCFNPEHYNYICFDPNCNDTHCLNEKHYDKNLLKSFQEKTDFSIYNHSEKNNHDNEIDINLCDCHDCVDKDEEELLAEGKPLLSNRPIQIIVSSGILFALGYLLKFMAFDSLFINIIFIIAAIIAGYQIAILAYKSLYDKHTVSPALLACIACAASFIIGYPEEGAAVSLLYFIAEFLEDYAEHRAKHSIKSLVEIAPETARLKVGDSEEIRKIEDVNVSETVIVKPGDKVPLDGEIISGISSINQASITGESLPITKTIGDNVFAGTVNQDGYLEVKVTKKSKDTVISKIINLVKSSQLNKANTENMIERIAKYYTPVMIVIAAIVAFIPPLLFNQDWISWIYKALSIMVISCPCAFLISTPIGMISAITAAAKKGVIIKGSSYVEDMKDVKAVIFDKTGTLTEGKLKLSEVKVLNDKYSEENLIKIAASLENQSNHPIANAITDYACSKNIKISEISNFKNIPGKGIIGFINGKEYYAANESLIEGGNFEISSEEIDNYASEGKTVVFIGDKFGVIGILTVVDKIRENVSEIIHDFNSQNIQTIMLTGDNKVAAQKVADDIGIKYVYSNLLPEDKLNILDTIRNKFGSVAMVGDGINDAPALARANVGIAMGVAGSDVAIETADVALMQDNISNLLYLFDLSKKTMTIIKENITTAIIIKILFVILAIFGVITLMMSVGIGDLGLTMIVVLNSFRIGFVKDSLF